MLILFFYLATLFFILGIAGLAFYKSSFIQNLVNLEVCMSGIVLSFILYSVFFVESVGQMHALFIIVLAAAESCFGLALVSVLLRIRGNLGFESRFNGNTKGLF